MKKFFLIVTSILLLSLILVVGVIFYNPLIILNPHVLAWALNKTNVFETWSWKHARFSHERKNLLHRNLEGEFEDFCFVYDKPALHYETCFDSITWDFDLLYKWKKGVFAHTLQPFTVNSSFTKVVPGKSPEPEKPTGPPDIRRYWNFLWHPMVPDMDLDFQNISLKTGTKTFDLFVKAVKREEALRIDVPKFLLNADPSGFVITSVDDIPFKDYHFRFVRLIGKMKKKGVTLDLSGEVNSIQIMVDSFMTLPLVGEFTSPVFLKDLLLKTTGEVRFMDLKKNLKNVARPPYNELPAPFNVLDGNVIAHLGVSDRAKEEVNFLMSAGIRLKSKDQVVDVDIGGEFPFHVRNYSMGLATVGIDFNQLKLNLPKFSKKFIPPQMKPDGRFKSHEEIIHPKEKKPMPVMLNLTALNKKSLNIKSNLLDEVLRLNFDLHIGENGIQDGYLKVLPLKTTVLKRVIKLRDLVVKFEAPLTPIIKANVFFPTADYKIYMDLEGPLREPRYVFSSVPPLAESDIFSVLIYGRPMEDLGASDKSSASASTQILKQGVLSLTTLYLLSGTPIEYVGYDQEKKSSFAQIGLGDKSSLRISGGREGVNSTDLRRSIGKGWFIDTSVQNTNTGVHNNTNSKTQDFGVMLERIISY